MNVIGWNSMGKKQTHEESEMYLDSLSKKMHDSIIYNEKIGAIHGYLFHCQPVMDFANYLRTKTLGSELGAQHHAFKILFKYFHFGNSGEFEVRKGINRLDIFLPDQNLAIEVKTITQMTIMKVYQKAQGVIHNNLGQIDRLWLFFFYKVLTAPKIHPSCKYLLSFFDINLVDENSTQILEDLTTMVEESKEFAARRLDIPTTLIVPLENLIKVEDLERIVKEKEEVIHEKEEVLTEKEELIQKILKEKDQLSRENEKLKRELLKLKKKE
jgi:hypothetical protein